MKLIKPRSVDDIKECVELYISLNDFSFLDVDYNNAFKHLLHFAKTGKFIMMKLDDNDNIVAWILALKAQTHHAPAPMLQQVYYASSRKGVKAYRDVVDLHEAMIEEAQRTGLRMVISQGSHLDEGNTFSRILEKNGWERRGHTALKRLD